MGNPAPTNMWKAGMPSPNPGGRPAVDPEVRKEIMEIFAAAAPDAARKLVALVADEDPRVSTAAAVQILDRLLGKPVANIQADVRTSSVQAAHLAALQELRDRRLREKQQERGDVVTIIDVTPTSES